MKVNVPFYEREGMKDFPLGMIIFRLFDIIRYIIT
jgi:hypothetical protein